MWGDKSDLYYTQGQSGIGKVWSNIAKIGPGKTCLFFFLSVLGLLSVFYSTRVNVSLM